MLLIVKLSKRNAAACILRICLISPQCTSMHLDLFLVASRVGLQASTVALLEKAIVSAEEETAKGLDTEISAAKKKLSELQAAEAKTRTQPEP